MKALTEFLLGERVTNAIIEEWRHGDKTVAVYVVVACYGLGVSGVLKILQMLQGM